MFTGSCVGRATANDSFQKPEQTSYSETLATLKARKPPIYITQRPRLPSQSKKCAPVGFRLDVPVGKVDGKWTINPPMNSVHASLIMAFYGASANHCPRMPAQLNKMLPH
jgi:hypothetical protein